MKNNNIDEFDVGKNKFIYSQKKTKQPISKKFLLENLERILNNTDEAEKITELLLDARQEKLTDNLKNLSSELKENMLVKDVIEFLEKDKKRPICTPFSK